LYTEGGVKLGSLSASCAQQKCSTSGSSSGITGSATGVSMKKAGDDWGTVVFSVSLPTLETACFDIYAGGSGATPSDVLPPGVAPLCADKVPGRGQTYLFGGVM
jgi:hypothetical protein